MCECSIQALKKLKRIWFWGVFLGRMGLMILLNRRTAYMLLHAKKSTSDENCLNGERGLYSFCMMLSSVEEGQKAYCMSGS